MKVKTLTEKFDRDDIEKAVTNLDKRVNKARTADLGGNIVFIQDNVITVSDHAASTFVIIRTLTIKESKPQ